MAVFGDNPEFGKELNEAAKTFSDASGIAKNSINDLNKQIEDLNITQADNIEKQKGLNEELENSELPEFSKEIIALKENIKMLANDIEESSGKLKSLKEEKKSAKDDLDKAALEMFQSMNAQYFKISEAELERRKEFDRKMKVSQEALADLKKSNPEATTEIDRVSSTLKKREDKEQKKRDKQQTSVFSKGFKGISNRLEDIKDKSGVAIKSGLFIAAYFALAKFLQSDMFKKITSFIYDVILPNIREIGLTLGVLAAAFISFKIVSIISGIVTAFKAFKIFLIAMKVGLGLASTPLLVIVGVVAVFVAAVFAIFKGVQDFLKSMDEGKDFLPALFDGIATMIGTFLGIPFDLLFKLVGFIAGLFGFDDFKAQIAKLDPIGDLTKDIKRFFGFIGDIFSKIFNFDYMAFFKGIPGVGKVMDYFGFGEEEPEEGTAKAKRKNTIEKMNDAMKIRPLGMGKEELKDDNFKGADKSTTKKIKDNEDSITAKKLPVATQNNTTVVNNTNVNNAGGAVNHSYGSRTVLDGSNQYANLV